MIIKNSRNNCTINKLFHRGKQRMTLRRDKLLKKCVMIVNQEYGFHVSPCALPNRKLCNQQVIFHRLKRLFSMDISQSMRVMIVTNLIYQRLFGMDISQSTASYHRQCEDNSTRLLIKRNAS